MPPLTYLDGTLDATLRRRVLAAGVDQLAASNIASFRLEAVAARAGVELDLVKQIWPSGPDLFVAMLEDFAERHMPVPDTGTFRGDLLEYARSYALMVNTPTGRRMLDALLVKPQDWDLSDSRAVFLDYRVARIGPLVQRAIERGECPDGTDPALTIDMLAIGLCLPVLLYDRPITDEHCQYVVRTLLNGITGKH
ncbi:MAG: TetR/AcrR family transcriptional regulator C-terminal ligand-binding domain-containing protein [Mycobacterium sp.]|nr:TetR/AcrR family transcriptional regulator C-terminal ligand-binding domain-containing protein [Mycobacterium sp.]